MFKSSRVIPDLEGSRAREASLSIPVHGLCERNCEQRQDIWTSCKYLEAVNTERMKGREWDANSSLSIRSKMLKLSNGNCRFKCQDIFPNSDFCQVVG